MSEKGGKKGEEGQLWRAVSCKQAAGQYTCLSPVHDHGTACPHFLVNSCFSPQRELCECSSYLCVRVRCQQTQVRPAGKQSVCLVLELDIGGTRSHQPGAGQEIYIIYMITVCVYLVNLKAVLFCPYLSAGGQPCLLVYVCWGNTLSLISG